MFSRCKQSLDFLPQRKFKINFYDTHEYFTGVPELKDANLKRKVWKFFENWIFPRLPVVYTVNESVKNKYKAEYGNQISVVRNVPITEKIVPKEIPKNWDNKIILLMQGIGINPGRGGMELLETMKYLSPNYHLVFIGGGTLWNEIAQKRIEWNLEERVEMISKIKPAELKQYTRLAHLGFTLDGFENTNFLFNLPNKIFDYIHANIPVIATAIPEVKAIINQYKCGICLKTTLPSEIAPEIENLINNKEYYQLLKHNTIQAAKELCWEIEKQKIISIYKQYI